MNNNQINNENTAPRKVQKKVIWISLAGVVILILACIFLFKSPHKVTFVTNSPSASIKPEIIDPETGQISFPKDPTRNGFYFTGWYTDKELTNKWDIEHDKFAKKNSLTGLYEKENGKFKVQNTTLYAGWEVDVIEIIYELDGGENSTNNPLSYSIKHEPTDRDIEQYGTYDKACEYTLADKVTLENPTKEGYEFDGWYTDAEFTNRVYSIDKVRITELDKTTLKTGVDGTEYYGHAPLTLYAKWIQK